MSATIKVACLECRGSGCRWWAANIGILCNRCGGTGYDEREEFIGLVRDHAVEFVARQGTPIGADYPETLVRWDEFAKGQQPAVWKP